METAGKLVEDEELRQQMKDSGLGTPATRAATIERLIKVGYIEREKKVLVPTEKGRSLIGLLGENPLSSPELTARWEERLAKMEKGEERRPDFMADISLPQMRGSCRRDEESLRLLGVEEERVRLRDLETGLRQTPQRGPGQTAPHEEAHRATERVQEQSRQALRRRAQTRR
jgi:hypothetical protein